MFWVFGQDLLPHMFYLSFMNVDHQLQSEETEELQEACFEADSVGKRVFPSI